MCTLEQRMKEVRWPCCTKAGSPIQRQMGKHITPWPKRALWQVCTVHRRGTWSYPGEVGSELKLRDQHSQLGKRLRKGASTQREPEHPWPQISWSGSASGLVSLEHCVWVAVTWDSFCWVCSSWWPSQSSLGI